MSLGRVALQQWSHVEEKVEEKRSEATAQSGNAFQSQYM